MDYETINAKGFFDFRNLEIKTLQFSRIVFSDSVTVTLKLSKFISNNRRYKQYISFHFITIQFTQKLL